MGYNITPGGCFTWYAGTNDEKMRLNSGGCLGIGISNPTYQVSVAGSICASCQGRFGNGTAGAPSYSFNSDSDSGMYRATTNELAFSTGATERVRIDSAGCVGINEDDIDAYLHLSNSGVINQKFERPGAAAWRLGIPASQTYFAIDRNNDNLSTPKLIIDSDGRVGIGTTTPLSALHVDGEAYISQDTSIMGNLSVHGDLTYINTTISTTSA